MNISNHAYQRYVERFKDKSEYKNIKDYILKNKNQITDEILEVFEGSTYIYKEKIGEYPVDAHYYIYQNINIIVNETNDCIITLYPINFGFECDKTNSTIIGNLIENIENLKLELTKVNEENNLEIQQKELLLTNVNTEIEYLLSQIDILKSQKNLIEQEIKHLNIVPDKIKNKIKRYVTKLCYSILYKKDFEKDMKAS